MTSPVFAASSNFSYMYRTSASETSLPPRPPMKFITGTSIPKAAPLNSMNYGPPTPNETALSKTPTAFTFSAIALISAVG